jgi:hypothetical protein
MVLCILACLVSLAAGFGIGRIKNKAKLDAIQAEINKVTAGAPAPVQALVAAIQAKF